MEHTVDPAEHRDIDAFTRRLDQTRRALVRHSAERLRWQAAWEEMLAAHARARDDLLAHPTLGGLLAEELRLNMDVLRYTFRRWTARIDRDR